MADYEQTIRELRDPQYVYHYSRDYLKNMMDDAADAIEELQRQVRALAEDNAAKYSGRVYILNQEAALAAAAGAKAIRGSKRLVGTTYVYDPFGKDGGPYEITYHQAEGILRAIWEGYPLKQEAETE